MCQNYGMPSAKNTTLMRAALFSALLTPLAACNRQPTPAAPPPAAAQHTGTSVKAGAPLIADSADRVHIEYHVQGEGEPVLVFIHGWSCDANYWKEQVAEFSQRNKVVTINLAGHGASGRNRTDWSMANYGEDVAAVMRAVPEGKVVLIGYSMGGPVALEAARRMPERVIGVIGVDTFTGLDRPPLPAADIAKFIAPFRADFIGATRTFVTNGFFTKSADPAFVAKVAEDMSLAPPEVAIPSMEALGEYDHGPALAAIKVPIMTISGDVAPIDEARIRKRVPGFRAVVLPNHGHFLMMEDPEAFNPVLEQEISRLASP